MENKLFSDCVCLNACPTADFMDKHTLKLLSVFLQTYHYDIKHFRPDILITNIEPKFFFASALNSVYLVYVKGVLTKTRNAVKPPETSQKLIKTTCNHPKSN